jgi:hypothetical protein
MAALIHVHRPASGRRRRILWCPVDERHTECVVSVYEWYSPIVTCVRCGESWSDGELRQRPFQRGWRRDAQRAAQVLWDDATYGEFPTPDEMRGDS